MNPTKRRVLLFFVLVLIVVLLVFLQRFQNSPGSSSPPSVRELGVNDPSSRIAQKAAQYPHAVELVAPDGYVNGANVTVGEHIGKDVIIIDFWTYSCINCQRTIPYLNDWYKKYHKDGLVIIGVHSPEFDFEKVHDNVKRAVEKFGIQYPVVQDNQYQTWNAYGNHYWPHKYLIDVDGFIVYDHVGEGGYDETEKKIQELLDERNAVLKLASVVNKTVSGGVFDQESRQVGTPEVYFGYGFSRAQFGNSEGWQPKKSVLYTLPEKTASNKFYLSGQWKNNFDNMELVGEHGTVTLRYLAQDVHFVAGASHPTTLHIVLDGKVKTDVTVHAFDLYTLVSENTSGQHTLEIRADEPGIMAYTFTFG